jgi:hypothetical protein
MGSALQEEEEEEKEEEDEEEEEDEACFAGVANSTPFWVTKTITSTKLKLRNTPHAVLHHSARDSNYVVFPAAFFLCAI